MMISGSALQPIFSELEGLAYCKRCRHQGLYAKGLHDQATLQGSTGPQENQSSRIDLFWWIVLLPYRPCILDPMPCRLHGRTLELTSSENTHHNTSQILDLYVLLQMLYAILTSAKISRKLENESDCWAGYSPS